MTKIKEQNNNYLKDFKTEKIKLSREKKRQARIQYKNKKAKELFQQKQAKKAPINVGKINLQEIKQVKYNGETKKSFFKRKTNKKTKEKINWKLAFREFPVKMIKEVRYIHWAKKSGLAEKFLITIIFIVIFTFFYFVLDQLFEYVLHVSHITAG